MDTVQQNRIADDVLPRVVMRRLDSVLEPTKDEVLVPKPLRFRADIEALERETEGILDEIVVG